MREFPGRLHHGVPDWVGEGGIFHIRIRCAEDNPVPLSVALLAPKLLESIRLYTLKERWWPHLFLLMPDHCHALLSFPSNETMSSAVGDWKRFHAKAHGVLWQDNFFDHRLRREESLEEKAAYIRSNPVAKGLCGRPEDWPWVVAASE